MDSTEVTSSFQKTDSFALLLSPPPLKTRDIVKSLN